MNQQPDKFFHDKLANFQRTAPASAWDKIDAGLNKTTSTKSIGLWWKVAASVTVLGVAAYLLWPTAISSEGTSSTTLAIANQKTQQPSGSREQQSEITAPVQEEKIKPAHQLHSVSEKKSTNTTDIPDTKAETVLVTEQSFTALQEIETTPVAENAVEQNNTTAPLPVEEEQAVAVNTVTARQPVRLVFTVTDSEEYLDKKALAQATDEEKEASTFKKLLKKAKDLKNNQDPFGDLREKKNEILALSFKNDKRGQNK